MSKGRRSTSQAKPTIHLPEKETNCALSTGNDRLCSRGLARHGRCARQRDDHRHSARGPKAGGMPLAVTGSICTMVNSVSGAPYT